MQIKLYIDRLEHLKYKIHSFPEFYNFFKKNFLTIDFNRGDLPFIITNGSKVLTVCQDFPNLYFFNIISKLFRKDTMPSFLETFGFNCLETKLIKSLDDIKWENFIIKPVAGFGYKNILSEQQTFFEHKKFRNKDHLLQIVNEKQFNSIAANQFVVQKTILGDSLVIRISGTYNSKSETYFVRNTISQMIEYDPNHYFPFHKNYYTNGRQKYALRTYKGFEKEKQLLYDMIKQLGLKNGSFSLELVKIDGALFPIDFNFNLSPYNARCSADINIDEFEKPLYHMFDIPNSLPELFPFEYEIKAPDYETLHLI